MVKKKKKESTILSVYFCGIQHIHILWLINFYKLNCFLNFIGPSQCLEILLFFIWYKLDEIVSWDFDAIYKYNFTCFQSSFFSLSNYPDQNLYILFNRTNETDPMN